MHDDSSSKYDEDGRHASDNDQCDSVADAPIVSNGLGVLSMLEKGTVTATVADVTERTPAARSTTTEPDPLVLDQDEGSVQSFEKATETPIPMSETFEAELDKIIADISPCKAAINFRARVYKQVEQILRTECQAVEVAPFGSFPLGTFLPDGDIDICAIFSPYVAVEPSKETPAQHYARSNGDVAAYWLLEVEKVLTELEKDKRFFKGGMKVCLKPECHSFLPYPDICEHCLRSRVSIWSTLVCGSSNVS